MAFEVFSNKVMSYSVVHVEIDYAAKLIRRTYSLSLPCVSGEINKYNITQAELNEAFDRDLFYSLKFRDSGYVSKLVDYDSDRKFLIQEYTEPSLLLTGRRPSVEEVLELFKFYKSHGINKINNALSNLTYSNQQLIAFDFKYTRQRPEANDREFASYDNWMVKIDPSLPTLLKEMH